MITLLRHTISSYAFRHWGKELSLNIRFHADVFTALCESIINCLYNGCVLETRVEYTVYSFWDNWFADMHVTSAGKYKKWNSTKNHIFHALERHSDHGFYIHLSHDHTRQVGTELINSIDAWIIQKMLQSTIGCHLCISVEKPIVVQPCTYQDLPKMWSWNETRKQSDVFPRT